MFTQERDKMRQAFIDVWRKCEQNLPLEPLESIIREVIVIHPEYHACLQIDGIVDKDYLPEVGEVNPFLHLGLHIALYEQLTTDRPLGIQALYRKLCAKYVDSHDLEHHMMECLAEVLWSAQRQGTSPNEQAYLANLRRL
jgi:hypothetical protein